jgi:formylglycine-generating enzyme required for sulfatase activity
MAGKIFISYRRDDDPSAAARVSDGLALRFGKANLFIDVHNLLAGQRFDEELAKALTACDVLIAVIGQRWMDLLKEKTTGGARDYVREEIAAALRRRIAVVPVRVGREGQLPPLPRAEDLPADIRDLVLYQKEDVAYERFDRDIGELIEAITAVRRSKRPEHAVPRGSWGWIGAMVASALAITYFGAHYLGVSVPWPGSPAAGDPAQSVKPGSGQNFQDRLANGQPCPMCPEMVVAPAGTFMMGSPPDEPERDDDEVQVRVTIARPFAVGKFAVSFAGWDACVADGDCDKRGDGSRGRHPVINVSWNDAKVYIDWLNAKTGKTYRLLSEAEREYVTRAGTTTPFWWGPAITPKQANYDGSAEPYKGGGTKGEYRRQTVPVDSFEANPWGLFNVHGNVWEWTEDCWNDSNQGNPGNGSARTTGDCNRHVVRGGSWISIPRHLRAAVRNTGTIFGQGRVIDLGFRLARTLNP